MNSRPAVPEFLARQLGAALPPGHVFFMYFPATMTCAEAKSREAEIHQHKAEQKAAQDRAAKQAAKKFLDKHAPRKAWHFDDEGKADGRTAVEKAGAASQAAAHLRQRQRALAAATPAVMTYSARLASPLATGLGIEHPTENGFAFLWPYGVPFLPGSAIKGALRRAAEMLATGEASGLADDPAPGQPRWTLPAVWALFGFDSSALYNSRAVDLCPPKSLAILEHWLALGVAKNSQAEKIKSPQKFLASPQSETGRRAVHARGALEFWDAFPVGPITVDIMNPHAYQYYEGRDEGRATPAECDAPRPVFFLAIKSGAELDFYVRCQTRRLHADLVRDWQPLLRQAFALAGGWLGFGAKTAVGYGALAESAPAANAAPPVGTSTRPAAAAPPARSAPTPPAAPAAPAAPALGGKAAELRENVRNVRKSRRGDIPSAVDGWRQKWLDLPAADQAVLREEIVKALREWRKHDPKSFAKRAGAKHWLIEWLSGAEEPKR